MILLKQVKRITVLIIIHWGMVYGYCKLVSNCKTLTDYDRTLSYCLEVLAIRIRKASEADSQDALLFNRSQGIKRFNLGIDR